MLAMCAAPAAVAAQAGSVIFVSGEAQIIGGDGKARNAAKGDAVNEGDTLVTGRVGALHLRMADDGYIAMRPDTRMIVQNFNWNGKEDGAERSVMSLVRGGFRAITGVIGKRNKGNYLVHTPTATMGIRGTDHEPHYIAPPAPGETPIGEPGAYNKVNVGAVYITNATGTIELGPKEAGFASAVPGRAPQRLITLPGFMRNAPTPIGPPDFLGMRDEERTAQRRELFVDRVADWVDGDEQRARLMHMLLRYAVLVSGGNFDLNNPASSLSVAQPGYATVGGLYAFGVPNTGGTVVGPDSNSLILLGGQNRPLFIADISGFQYARGNAPLIDSGTANIGATPINWGIYLGGTGFKPDKGAFPVQGFHFISTPDVTSKLDLQIPGSASFSTTVGFTQPINNLGAIGGTASLSVSVNFGATPTITAYTLNVLDGSGRSWAANMPGTQTLVSFAKAKNTPNLVVSCTPCGVGVGYASGFVVGGAARNGLISSYDLKTLSNATVSGSIAVK